MTAAKEISHEPSVAAADLHKMGDVREGDIAPEVVVEQFTISGVDAEDRTAGTLRVGKGVAEGRLPSQARQFPAMVIR